MNLIQDFLEKKGIEDIIVTYDKFNEPVTPSYILQEFMKELYPIHGVSNLLKVKEELTFEAWKEVRGFIDCMEYYHKNGDNFSEEQLIEIYNNEVINL